MNISSRSRFIRRRRGPDAGGRPVRPGSRRALLDLCRLVGARGDALLPYPPSALLELLIGESDTSRHELDAQLDKATLLANVNPQTQLERMAMKGVFPTDPRDFIALGTWFVEPDGTVIIAATSADAAVAEAEAAGAVFFAGRRRDDAGRDIAGADRRDLGGPAAFL